MHELFGVLPVIASRIPYSSWKDVEDVSEYFLRYIVDAGKREFLEKGAMAPLVNIMGNEIKASSRLGRRTPQIVQYSVSIGHMVGSQEAKNVLAQVMPEFLQDVGAFCVVTAMESWALFGQEVRTVYERYGSIAAHPESQEALTFLFENSSDTRMEAYPILREGNDVTLGENIAPIGDAVSLEGTFTRWLRTPPERVLN